MLIIITSIVPIFPEWLADAVTILPIFNDIDKHALYD